MPAVIFTDNELGLAIKAITSNISSIDQYRYDFDFDSRAIPVEFKLEHDNDTLAADRDTAIDEAHQVLHLLRAEREKRQLGELRRAVETALRGLPTD